VVPRFGIPELIHHPGLPDVAFNFLSDHPKAATDYHLKTGQRE